MLLHRQDPEPLEEDVGNHERIAQAFVVLQLIGAFGLLAVILTAAVGRYVKRSSTWYNFGISWIISSVSYTLLAIAGQRTGAEPDFGVCVVQSALIYAAPSLTGCTTLALITHMLMNIRRLLANAPFSTNARVVVALLVVPYIVWLAIFLSALLYGIANPDTIQRSPNTTYCNSTNTLWSKVSSLIVAGCMVLIVIALSVIGKRLYRNRRAISGSSQSFALVARVMIFSLLGVLALGVAIAYVMTAKHGQAFDIILACLPVLAVLVFGSQLDLIRTWTCQAQIIPRRDKAVQSQYSSVSTQEAT